MIAARANGVPHLISAPSSIERKIRSKFLYYCPGGTLRIGLYFICTVGLSALYRWCCSFVALSQQQKTLILGLR